MAKYKPRPVTRPAPEPVAESFDQRVVIYFSGAVLDRIDAEVMAQTGPDKKRRGPMIRRWVEERLGIVGAA